MRKTKFFVLCLFLSLLFSFAACQKEEQPTVVTTPRPSEQTQPLDDGTSTTEATTKPLPEATTVDSTKPVTYYTESKDNFYIKAVAKAYAAEPSHLVALIRTNTKTEGATVLEFSGQTDANGALLKTSDTLVAVYDMNKTATSIRKATPDGSGNVGYQKNEGDAVFALAKRFILPNLDKMKAERTSQKA